MMPWALATLPMALMTSCAAVESSPEVLRQAIVFKEGQRLDTNDVRGTTMDTYGSSRKRIRLDKAATVGVQEADYGGSVP